MLWLWRRAGSAEEVSSGGSRVAIEYQTCLGMSHIVCLDFYFALMRLHKARLITGSLQIYCPAFTCCGPSVALARALLSKRCSAAGLAKQTHHFVHGDRSTPVASLNVRLAVAISASGSACRVRDPGCLGL